MQALGEDLCLPTHLILRITVLDRDDYHPHCAAEKAEAQQAGKCHDQGQLAIRGRELE